MIIIILILVIVLVCIIRSLYLRNKYYFKCSKCNYKWKPSVIKTLGNMNKYIDSYYLQCSHCKTKEKIELVRKNSC